MRYYICLTNTSNLHGIDTKIHWIKSILRYFHWIIFRQMEIISKIQNIMLKTTTCSHKIFTWLPSTIKQLLEKFNFKLLHWSFQQTLNKWIEARHIYCQVKSSWVLAIFRRFIWFSKMLVNIPYNDRFIIKHNICYSDWWSGNAVGVR